MVNTKFLRTLFLLSGLISFSSPVRSAEASGNAAQIFDHCNSFTFILKNPIVLAKAAGSVVREGYNFASPKISSARQAAFSGAKFVYNMEGKTGAATLLGCTAATLYLYNKPEYRPLTAAPLALLGAWTCGGILKKYNYESKIRNIATLRNPIEDSILGYTTHQNNMFGLSDWRANLGNSTDLVRSLLTRTGYTMNQLNQYKDSLDRSLAYRKAELAELDSKTGLAQLIHGQRNTVQTAISDDFSLEAVAAILRSPVREDGNNFFEQDFDNRLKTPQAPLLQKGLGMFMHGFFNGPEYNASVFYTWKRLRELALLLYVRDHYVRTLEQPEERMNERVDVRFSAHRPDRR